MVFWSEVMNDTSDEDPQGQFECKGCGSIFVVVPKFGNDVEDVEFCPFCGTDQIG